MMQINVTLFWSPSPTLKSFEVFKVLNRQYNLFLRLKGNPK